MGWRGSFTTRFSLYKVYNRAKMTEMKEPGYTEERVCELSKLTKEHCCIDGIADSKFVGEESKPISNSAEAKGIIPEVSSTFAVGGGGTIIFDYIGEYDLLLQTVRTKTVYFSTNEVVCLQEILYNPGILTTILNHSFNDYQSQGAQGHTRWCTTCGYIEQTTHILSKWTKKNAREHVKSCTKCSYETTGLHSDSYNQLLGKCNLCGYVGFTQLNLLNRYVISKKQMDIYT